MLRVCMAAVGPTLGLSGQGPTRTCAASASVNRNALEAEADKYFKAYEFFASKQKQIFMLMSPCAQLVFHKYVLELGVVPLISLTELSLGY